MHPFLFAGVYKTAEFFATALNVSAPARTELLIVGPKTLQAVVSAIGDFYTWRLATRIYGEDTTGAWTTVRDMVPCRTWWRLRRVKNTSIDSLTAHRHRPESLAMVLLDKNLVKLLGNNGHNRRVGPLAMAVVSGCYSRQ